MFPDLDHSETQLVPSAELSRTHSGAVLVVLECNSVELRSRGEGLLQVKVQVVVPIRRLSINLAVVDGRTVGSGAEARGAPRPKSEGLVYATRGPPVHVILESARLLGKASAYSRNADTLRHGASVCARRPLAQGGTGNIGRGVCRHGCRAGSGRVRGTPRRRRSDSRTGCFVE